MRPEATRADRRWTEARLIVFTEYADTKRYLRRQLDAAREGVNLQGYCADLFHHDVPWNPARIEQRNGRIDRTLQRASEVFCHYFFYPQRVEDRVLQVLVRKVDRIQRELGSLGTVIAERIGDALEDGIDDSSIARLDSAESLGGTVDQFHRDRAAGARELRRDRASPGGCGRGQPHPQRVHEASFEAEHLRDAIDVGLELAGAGPLIPLDQGRYRLPDMPAGWERPLDTMRPPRRRDEELWEWRKRPPLPVVFKAPESMTSDVVHLHLHHPFVQRIVSRFSGPGLRGQRPVAGDRGGQRPGRPHPGDRFRSPDHLWRGRQPPARGAHRVAARWLEGRGERKPFAEEADRKAVEQLEHLLGRGPELAVSAAVQARLGPRRPGTSPGRQIADARWAGGSAGLGATRQC